MTTSEELWMNYQITETDLEGIYNYLLEIEQPLNKNEITQFLIQQVIQREKDIFQKEKQAAGLLYLPKLHYQIGDTLVFPQFNWLQGKVQNVRKGNNPDYLELEVLDILFGSGETKLVAANLHHHFLNEPVDNPDADLLTQDFVFKKFGSTFSDKITTKFATSSDLVCIAGNYFPSALLIEISVGHLNLCEAVLEMAEGGPLSTVELLKQIEFPTDVNSRLTEFSLDRALEQDGRFDEVGPAGITSWFLKRLEPPEVQTPPLTLRYTGDTGGNIVDIQNFGQLNADICDELEPDCAFADTDSVSVSLSYPHWRAGTLPLTSQLKSMFPTAYETPRVKFTFIDGNNNTYFPGWVVRPSKYIYGLRDWYVQQGLIPGSIVTINKSTNPGEVIVHLVKNRSNKDWMRTVLVGTDGGVVFALLKQVITCTYDDRMAIMIPDGNAVDSIWANAHKSRYSVEKTIQNTMKELSKLTPQGQIHAQELYAAVNITRRVPPSVIMKTLLTQPWSIHLGDLYFRYGENSTL